MSTWRDGESIVVERPVDPYLLWARDTGFRYASVIGSSANGFASVIIECKVSALELLHWATRPVVLNWIRIPPQYGSQQSGLSDTKFCTAQVSREQLESLVSTDVEGFWSHVSRFELAADVSISAIAPRSPPLIEMQSAPGDVCAGIIDIGTPFARHDYRNKIPLAGGSKVNRVVALWDQSDGKLGGVVSPAFGYGREWSETFANDPVLGNFTATRLLKGTNDVSGEENLYRKIDWDIADRSNSHGAAVLGEMSGTRNYGDRRQRTDAAALVPIFVVQLPRATVSHSARASLAAHVLDGLRWMLSHIRPNQQLVVTISLGTHAGPHDGSSIIEQAIDELTEKTTTAQGKERLAVVLAAGNSRESMSHAQFDLVAGKPKNIEFRVLPDDITPSFLEIWLPADSTLTIALTSPTSAISNACAIGQSVVLATSVSNAAAAIYRPIAAAGGGGQMALIAVAPTADGSAEHGIYTLVLTADSNITNVHAWIERDNSMFDLTRPRGRQSYFVDDRYAPVGTHYSSPAVVGSHISRDTTLNSYATGKRTVVIGAFDAARGRVAADSSSGPIRHASAIVRPDAAAVGDESLWVAGHRVSGTRSGDTARLRGSSIAAPKVARRLINARLGGDSTPTARAVIAQAAADSELHAPVEWEPRPSVKLAGNGRIF
jgi:Subtilase family